MMKYLKGRSSKKLQEEFHELKKKYESLYSPLCIENVTSTSKWTWINNPWPWDKGGN